MLGRHRPLTAEPKFAGRSAAWLVVAVLAVAQLTGCAGAPKHDPFEPFNRKIFAFNETLDATVVRPAATTYQKVVPAPVRTGVTNFFGNVLNLWSAFNLVLQGRVGDALNDGMRFGVNSLFGVLGIFDVATDMGMERHNEDFGQTLGKWGLPAGPYLYFPILGPSSMRDSLGLPVELKFTPETFVNSTPVSVSMTSVRLLNVRANLLGATATLDSLGLDKYSFIRDAYLSRRRNLVYDGNAPDLPDEGDGGAAEPPEKAPEKIPEKPPAK